MLTLQEAILVTQRAFTQSSIQCFDPALHAKQLLQFVTGMSPAQFLTRIDRTLTPVEKNRWERLLERRLNGEPFQYLVGYEWFWDLPFEVGPGVLIPRKDTEVIVEFLLTLSQPEMSILELGAGSGNLGITVVRARPQWHWRAIEISELAARYAQKNAIGLIGASANYSVVLGDFFEQTIDQKLDAIVSNPPYIVTDEIQGLSKEVQSEPRLALDGGPTGFEILDQLFDCGSRWLKPGGLVVTEVGYNQAKTVVDKLDPLVWQNVRVLPDTAGIDRVIVAFRRDRENS